MAWLVCAVSSCQQIQKLPADNKSVPMHQFPLHGNVEVLQKWLKFVGQPPNWKPDSNSCICSAHFSPSCYMRINNKKVLKNDAAPTIFSVEVISRFVPTKTNNSDQTCNINSTLKRPGTVKMMSNSNTNLNDFNPKVIVSPLRSLKKIKFSNDGSQQGESHLNGVLKVPKIILESLENKQKPILMQSIKSKPTIITTNTNSTISSPIIVPAVSNISKNITLQTPSKPFPKCNETSMKSKDYLNQFLGFVGDYKRNGNPTNPVKTQTSDKVNITRSTVNLIPKTIPVVFDSQQSLDQCQPVSNVNESPKPQTEPQLPVPEVHEYVDSDNDGMENIEYLDDSFAFEDIEMDYLDNMKNHLKEVSVKEDTKSVKNDLIDDCTISEAIKEDLPNTDVIEAEKKEEEIPKPLNKESKNGNLINDNNIEDEDSDEIDENDDETEELTLYLHEKIDELYAIVNNVLDEIKSLRQDVKSLTENKRSKMENPKIPFKNIDEFSRFDENYLGNPISRKFLKTALEDCIHSEWNVYLRTCINRIMTTNVQVALRENQISILHFNTIADLLNLTVEAYPTISKATVFAEIQKIISEVGKSIDLSV